MEHRCQSIAMMKRRHTTVLDDLPEWIVIEEILIWLPPKDLFRCRAVCKLWRSATSTDKFMLDNCHRQPSLPVIRQDIPGHKGVSESDFWICNPATRKCAILPQPRVPSSSARVPRIYIAGFYQHQPSGEYRVLWFSRGCLRGYVLRFGSDKPRIISQPSVSSRLPEFWHQGEFDSCYGSQVNHRGSLHWLTGNYMETAVDIMVFDTVTETFR
uniref:F-box domain-containing protein n=1 Tax=Aegilops tauschii subsp. strangulata TaxID=200361 RepID=A0A453ST40_AEGTS